MPPHLAQIALFAWFGTALAFLEGPRKFLPSCTAFSPAEKRRNHNKSALYGIFGRANAEMEGRIAAQALEIQSLKDEVVELRNQ